MGGWRVHGVGGWVVVWVVVGWVVGGFPGVGAYTHPPMNSYNVKIFNFMKTQPPTHQTYLKCHSVTIHILWRVHGVGGGGLVGGFMGWVDGWVVGGFMGWVVVGWVVGGFMGWVGVWWWGAWWGVWLENSWVGE